LVVVILTRSSGPWTVSARGGGGPKEASPISLSLLVLGALNDSAMADSVSLSLNPFTPSEPSALGLGVLGSFPSAGGLETDALGVGASAASLDRLEIGVCP